MPNPSIRLLAVAVCMSLAGAALAQGTRPLDNVSACRLDEERIVLRFTFEGGACQEPGTATVGRDREELGTVTVPTTNVGEACTMQIVEVEFADVIDVAPDITTLDITVLAPEGGPQALGSTDIAADPQTPCEAPASE